MRREVLRLSDGSFTVVFAAQNKLKKTQMVELSAPQGKRSVDNLDVALHGLELFEIPLEGF